MKSESLQPPWSGMNSRRSPVSVKPLFAARTTSAVRAIVTGARRQLEEQHVRGQRTLRRPREAVDRASRYGASRRRHVRLFAEPEPADQRHRRDVGGLVEIVTVHTRQFLGERARRPLAPPIELPARIGRLNGRGERLEDLRTWLNAPRRDASDVRDRVL